MRVSAAMLAGGRSERMGSDKALLSLRAGDPPMGALIVERLRALSDDVMLVAPDRPGYRELGARLVDDLYPGAGGLGGIASALAAARCDACIVVGCDLPFLSVPLLRALAEQAARADAVVPRTPGESRQGGRLVFHTLHAVYARACLTPIEAHLAAGQRQIIRFFPDVRVVPVDDADLRRFDPGLRSLFNANTPEAAEQARRWLGAGRRRNDPRS